MSQLHIPGPAGKGPLCGRQLNNHREGRSQVSDRVVFAQDQQAYLKALLEGKACRHCGYASGFIVRSVTRQSPESEDSDE